MREAVWRRNWVVQLGHVCSRHYFLVVAVGRLNIPATIRCDEYVIPPTNNRVGKL